MNSNLIKKIAGMVATGLVVSILIKKIEGYITKDAKK
jgi:hypothetical protein